MKKWIVIMAYDQNSIPGFDPDFSGIHEEFLYCDCFEAQLNQSYATFKFQNTELKIECKYIREIRKPGFDYNEKVESLAPRSKHVGSIYKIRWNFEYQEFRYYLWINKKMHESYFTESELVSVSQWKSV